MCFFDTKFSSPERELLCLSVTLIGLRKTSEWLCLSHEVHPSIDSQWSFCKLVCQRACSDWSVNRCVIKLKLKKISIENSFVILALRFSRNKMRKNELSPILFATVICLGLTLQPLTVLPSVHGAYAGIVYSKYSIARAMMRRECVPSIH